MLTSDLGSLIAGTGFAQGLSVVVAPVLARFYGPEAFGVFAVYLSVVVFANSFISGRYEYAIPLPEVDDDAEDLVVLAIAITGVLCGGTYVLLTIPAVQNGLGFVDPFTLWLVPFAVLCESSRGAAKLSGIRTQKYPLIAQNEAGQAGLRALLQVGLGVFHPVAGTLILADLGTRVVAAVTLVARVVPGLPGRLIQLDVKNLKRLAHRYRDFPLLSAPATLLNSATNQLPTVILLAAYGPAVAGTYALSIRLLAAPINLIGKSTLQVYMGRAADARRSGESLLPLFRANVQRTSVVGAAIIAPLAGFASFVAPPILGDAWAQTGEFLRILTPLYCLNFVALSVGPTLAVLERQGLQLLREALRSAIVLGGLFMAIRLDEGPVLSLFAYSVGGCFGYLLFLVTAFTAIRQDDRDRGSWGARGPAC